MTSCNALVYEAILRVYRNAMPDLIRSGMQTAYPDDYEKRVTSAIPSWEEIVGAAARSAATGVVAHPHEDVFDYLDVSHFPVLLNNYFSVLAPVEGLSPEQSKELQKRVAWYVKEIKAIRDPLSHPGPSDISVFDAFRALDNASRALHALGLPGAAEKIKPLLREVAAQASAAPVMMGKPVRLLPRPECLAGRDDLLTGLHVRLSSGADSRPRTVVLCGLGGAGKTSVAVEYAHEHLDEVGLAGSSTSTTTLILRWNGTAWKQVPSPSPAGGGFSGVTATSASNAWAVGDISCGCGPGISLILRWNGTAWKRVPSPTPGGGTILRGVAATSASNAWAVGYSGSGIGPTKTLILRLNGTTWNVS